MLRVVEHLGGRSRLDDLAVLHHDHAVRPVGRDGQVVRDEQDGRAAACRQVGEQVQHASLDRHVERAGGLVGDDQLGLARQRDPDEDTLAHAAGQLVRVLPGAGGGLVDADGREDLDGPGPGTAAARAAVEAQHLGHLVADALHRVQRDARVLRDQSDAVAAHTRPRPLGQGAQVERAVRVGPEPDAPGRDAPGGGQQTDHGVRGGRLARPGLPDQRDDLARCDVQVDTAHGAHGPGAALVVDVQVADAQHGALRRRDGRAGGRGRGGAHRALLPCGSRVRPRRPAASTTATMTTPGSVEYHHAVAR